MIRTYLQPQKSKCTTGVIKPPEAAGAGKGKGGRSKKGSGQPGGAGGGEREAVVAAKGEKLKEEMAQVIFVFNVWGVLMTSHSRPKTSPCA